VPAACRSDVKQTYADASAPPAGSKGAGPNCLPVLGMTQSLNEMEQRYTERVQVNLPVMVSADQERRIRGCMRNLSLGGALLRIDADWHLPALALVSVELSPPFRRPARLLAHVSRRSKEDLGVEWSELARIVVRDLLRSSAMWRPP
jgi:hypothetical protein